MPGVSVTERDGARPLRADARRNREHIVAAASVLLVERGTDVPMEDIARAAGVGVGTLYRRFPNRRVLINAVAVDIFQRLGTMGRAARAREPNAGDALRRFLRDWATLRLGLLHTTLCAVLPDATASDAELRRVRQDWLGLFDRMVRDAQEAGAVRVDVGSGDIAAFMNMLIRDHNDQRDGLTARLLELVLDGLRPAVGSTLPGRPATLEELAGDHTTNHTATVTTAEQPSQHADRVARR